LLKGDLPVAEYEPGTWGPASSADVMIDGAAWHDPQVEASSPC
jgi:glucose-6-phosphate 1-dehydrogenase